MHAVHPVITMVIQGLLRCEIDVPEQTLIGLSEACNYDFVAEVSAFRELLRTPDAALPPAFIDEVIDLSAFLVERSGSHHSDFRVVEPATIQSSATSRCRWISNVM
jgi:hypothetical protein